MDGGIEKGVFRKAISDLIPASIVSRRKTSYPTTLDPIYERTLAARVKDIIEDKDVTGRMKTRNQPL